jgi:hypothetical protein
MNDATKAKDDAALAAAFGDVKTFVATFRGAAEKLSAK